MRKFILKILWKIFSKKKDQAHYYINAEIYNLIATDHNYFYFKKKKKIEWIKVLRVENGEELTFLKDRFCCRCLVIPYDKVSTAKKEI